MLSIAMLALVPQGADAQTTFNFDNYCVTGSYTVCASVRATVSADGKTITMDAWNLQGSAGFDQAAISSLSSFGLYHVGSNYDWSGKYSYKVEHINGGVITDISSYFKKGASNIQVEVGTDGTGNNGVNGCTLTTGGMHWRTCNSFPTSPFVRITFNLTQSFSTQNVALRWHAQQLPDGSSIKCDTTDPRCVPTTTVPEPMTAALLGTGLLGLGGVRFLKRRRSRARGLES
jgi:hypothetical protein